MTASKPDTQAMNKAAEGHYASVNGLQLYYELHGVGRPLVLLHGGLSGIATDFGELLPSLAQNRQVIGVEQQAHGHTADIDCPLTVEQMAEDTVELLRQLDIHEADWLGYSMGADIALQIAIRYPERVRKLVLVSVSYRRDGIHPGLLEGIQEIKPEDLAGSPFEEAYARTAPRPQDWPTLIAKIQQLDNQPSDRPAEAIRAIKAPTLLIIGDSDIVRPEHAVEMFRLLGGGVPGDIAGLPPAQLAVLPGTTHISVIHRTELLQAIIPAFLDAPLPEAR